MSIYPRRLVSIAIIAVAWPLDAPASAENWGQFRGGHAGVVGDAQLPQEWNDKQVVWKVSLPGVAWSQPVVWGQQVFVTTAETEAPLKPDRAVRGAGVSGFAALFGGPSMELPKENYRWKVLCLDAATGETKWEQVAREGRPTMKIHQNNTYASETPVTDGERLIAYFGMAGVYCYDLAGKLLWSEDLGAYPTQFGWGTGSSPVLYKDYVFVQCDNDKGSFLVALDKRTGDEVWRATRDERSNWSTPFLWENKNRTELVTAGGNQLRSYNPETGELLWFMKGQGRTATTPTGDAEMLYVDTYDRLTGTRGVFAAIRPGATGDISLGNKETSNAHVAWSVPIQGTRLASPLVYQNCVYVLGQGNAIVRCLDAQTGAEHFRERLPEAAGFTASPLACNGKIYCLDENGRTTVLAAGPELKILATSALDGGMCWASAAVAGDRLLIRTVDQLYCIGRD